MLGLLKIKDDKFIDVFEQLKQLIINDPIFQTFASIDKTKNCLHAKDDHIAIKREVFKVISKLDLSIQVIIRHKGALIQQAGSQFEFSNVKMTDKQIYKDLVIRLFKEKLHKADSYNIIFAQRGSSTENSSLQQALRKAGGNFHKSYGIKSSSIYKINCCHPSQYPGLQIIDYCLWALQRLYTKHEDAYFSIIKDKFKLIMDIDYKENKSYGEYYNNNNIQKLLDRIEGQARFRSEEPPKHTA